MNPFKKYFTTLLTGVIVLSISSCASLPANSQRENAGLPTTDPVNTSSVAQLERAPSTPAQPQKEAPRSTQPLNPPLRTEATSTAQSIKTVPVNIYKADSQCQTLVPEKAAVPAASPVNAAVGKVLQEAGSSDFELAGYRVNVNAKSRVATVDLRISPDSRRQFVSLSTCEQFALFASLRKTLTANSQLKIKNVRFTQQGREIKL